MSKREEIIARINENAQMFFERDGSGKGYVCPVCGSGSGKHGTGLTSWKENEKHWKCWNCGEGGDVIFWLMKSRNMEFNEVLEYGARAFGEELEKKAERKEEEKRQSSKFSLLEETEKLYEEAAAHLEETGYWSKRGLSLELCRRFGIGYMSKWRHPKAPEVVPYSPRLIIPLDKDGYLARDVREEILEEQKAYAKVKVGKMTLFNKEAMKSGTFFVVEGEIDALSVEEVGYKAVGLGSVVMKKRLVEEIEKMEKKPEIVILSMDEDKAGEEATKYMESELNKAGIFHIRGKISGKYKDANEALVADRQEFARRVEEVYKEALRAKELIGQDVNSFSYLELGQLEEDVEYFKKNAERVTGYKNIDEQGRLYPGLYVIGAVTGVGKTTFMQQMGNQLEERGEEVIYFSYEQSRFELISKGLSRITYLQSGGKNGVSSVQIRRGAQGESIRAAVNKYKTFAKNEVIYEAEFEDTVEKISKYVRERIEERGKNPVIIIDYLQVIATMKDKNGHQLNTKENIDNTVKKLKSLQREYGLVMFLISSLNRQNYLTQIDFESFKESGGIEYTADVVWGMQLVETRNLKKVLTVDEKREKLKKAKGENPRRIELICLKSRYSAPGYSCYFKYYPSYDYFEESTEEEVLKEEEEKSKQKIEKREGKTEAVFKR